MKTETEKKPMSRWKKRLIGAAVAAGLLLAAVGAAAGYVHTLNTRHQRALDQLSAEHREELAALLKESEAWEEASKQVDFTELAGQLQSIGELASTEYIYTDASKYSKEKEVFGYELPLGITTKTFIVKWDGIIKAGIDVQKIQVRGDEGTKTITVTLPRARILSHQIDNDSFETLDEKSGLFNPIKVSDVNVVEKDSKAAMEKRAIENGLLEEAETSARALVEQLLLANPVIRENYEVKFS